MQLNGNIQPPPTHDGAKVVFLVEDETQVSDEDLVNGMAATALQDLWKSPTIMSIMLACVKAFTGHAGDNALPQTPEVAVSQTASAWKQLPLPGVVCAAEAGRSITPADAKLLEWLFGNDYLKEWDQMRG